MFCVQGECIHACSPMFTTVTCCMFSYDPLTSTLVCESQYFLHVRGRQGRQAVRRTVNSHQPPFNYDSAASRGSGGLRRTGCRGRQAGRWVHAGDGPLSVIQSAAWASHRLCSRTARQSSRDGMTRRHEMAGKQVNRGPDLANGAQWPPRRTLPTFTNHTESLVRRLIFITIPFEAAVTRTCAVV